MTRRPSEQIKDQVEPPDRGAAEAVGSAEADRQSVAEEGERPRRRRSPLRMPSGESESPLDLYVEYL